MPPFAAIRHHQPAVNRRVVMPLGPHNHRKPQAAAAEAVATEAKALKDEVRRLAEMQSISAKTQQTWQQQQHLLHKVQASQSKLQMELLRDLKQARMNETAAHSLCGGGCGSCVTGCSSCGGGCDSLLRDASRDSRSAHDQLEKTMKVGAGIGACDEQPAISALFSPASDQKSAVISPPPLPSPGLRGTPPHAMEHL